MKKTNEDILICECHSTEHQLIVLYSNEDKHPMVYFHIHLNKRSFWERLKYGIKYVFGYQSQYGAFQEFILNPEDAHKMERVVKYLKDEKTV